MWESCLSGSVRGRGTTVIWTKYCGTAAKAGGNREDQPRPVVIGVPGLLEIIRTGGRLIYRLLGWNRWLEVFRRLAVELHC